MESKTMDKAADVPARIVRAERAMDALLGSVARIIRDDLADGFSEAERIVREIRHAAVCVGDAYDKPVDQDAQFARILQRIAVGVIGMSEADAMRVLRAGDVAVSKAASSCAIESAVEQVCADVEHVVGEFDDGSILPRVDAYVWFDGERASECSFDAAPWFEKATDRDILNLHQKKWVRRDVCFECAFDDPEAETVYMECSVHGARVDRDSAMAYLKKTREDVWAQILCAENGVEIVADGNGGKVEWGYRHVIRETGNVHEVYGYDTRTSQGAAALAAVAALGLDCEPVAGEDQSPGM